MAINTYKRSRLIKTVAMKKYRESASFGKRQEFSVIAELLKHGFDVYNTLVDDRGIDCIIRLTESRYLDIQIKASSKKATQPYNFGGVAAILRENFFFIFYIEVVDKFWVIPSLDFRRLFGVTKKEGKHKGKFNVVIPKSNSKKYGLFRKYEGENGILLLN